MTETEWKSMIANVQVILDKIAPDRFVEPAGSDAVGALYEESKKLLLDSKGYKDATPLYRKNFSNIYNEAMCDLRRSKGY